MKRQPAIYDFDGTLCAGNSFRLWLSYDLQRHPWRIPGIAWRWLAFRRGRLPNDQWRAAALAGLRGRTAEEIREIGDRFYHRRVRPCLRRWLVDELRRRKEAGACIVLATAAFDFIVAPFAAEAGAEVCMAWNLEYEGNRFTGRLVGPQPFNHEKLRRVKESTAGLDLDWSCSWAVSDSADDAPLLDAVTEAVLLCVRHEPAAAGRKWCQVCPADGMRLARR